jgi:hypothetical protein
VVTGVGAAALGGGLMTLGGVALLSIGPILLVGAAALLITGGATAGVGTAGVGFAGGAAAATMSLALVGLATGDFSPLPWILATGVLISACTLGVLSSWRRN